MKLYKVFQKVSKSHISQKEKSSLYKTIRELIKFRKATELENDIIGILSQNQLLGQYFTLDDFHPTVCLMHLSNLTKLCDICIINKEETVESPEDLDSDSESVGSVETVESHHGVNLLHLEFERVRGLLSVAIAVGFANLFIGSLNFGLSSLECHWRAA